MAFIAAVVAAVVGGNMSETLVLLGIVLAGLSGVPGLFVRPGQSVAVALAACGSAAGFAGLACYWSTGASVPISRPWLIDKAAFSVGMDGLSALFLAPVFLISLLGSIYGLDYWKDSTHADTGRKVRFFYGALTASMGLLLIARDAVTFLFGWEIMALSAFFLVATDDHEREVRLTSWIYLAATHTATLCLFAFFAILRSVQGSFALAPVAADDLTPGMAWVLFALALVGFGIKAGIMPLHIWLPGAHAITPSHVSALMSGVIIKMGIYGLVRMTGLLPTPPLAWGAVVLALGVVSGVLGVAFAIGQHDLKRLLAYHSIENIGIIVMGLGLALMGRTLERPDLIVLGLGGCLLHVWNHALFKSLLFLCAGSVIHAAHTREIDQLGGLAKSMPWTALGFLVGAVAICGLPPLNGFVSELLIYLGLFRGVQETGGTSFMGAAFAAAGLALIGALATACFVKVYGAVFLGTARSEHARHAQEAPRSMLGPIGVLAGLCCLIGLAPRLIAPMLGQAIAAWTPTVPDANARLVDLAPLSGLTLMGTLLVAALLLVGMVLAGRLRHSAVAQGPTWGCGYAAPTPRIQYTSSSFAQMLVGLFAWALRPRMNRPAALPLFPGHAGFHSNVPDTVLDGAVMPAFRFSAWLLSWFRVLQQGSTRMYLLYILAALIVLLLWR
jgi:hydrogenase-4 component B